MTNTNNFYDNAVETLLNNGWTKNNPASFTKGDFEIFFDTSSYIEVIRLSDKTNIFESHLNSNEIIIHILSDVIPESSAT